VCVETGHRQVRTLSVVARRNARLELDKWVEWHRGETLSVKGKGWHACFPES
jgi:hypothetical protein